MNIIDERNIRTIYRKLKKAEYDEKIQLATKTDQWVRLLDEGMVVDAVGQPLFYIKKRTLRSFYESLPEDYVGSINLGHMEFATFPLLLGQWTKKDLRLVDIGDGREALDVRLRLNESLGIVKDLRKMDYSLGVSAEFGFSRDEKATKELGFEVLDGVNIRDFAIVGDAGNVNSSGLELKGEIMKVKDLAALLESEEKTDLAALNKKLGALIDEGQAETAEPAAEPAVEETPAAEEAAEEPETPAEEVKEEAETPAEPAEAAPAEGEKGLSAIAAVIERLNTENAELKAELEKVKAELSAKNKAEQEFIEKFKNLSVSLATERVTENVEESTTDVVTDGIGVI